MDLIVGKITVKTPKLRGSPQIPDYEIRKYPSSVAAEINYDPSNLNGNRDGGFTILANYIGALGQPQNARPEKIAMAAPVITQFLLPAKHKNVEDAPRPLDKRVVIKKEGERRAKMAVEERVYRVAGEFSLARYNPPRTRPPLRTNEVMIVSLVL